MAVTKKILTQPFLIWLLTKLTLAETPSPLGFTIKSQYKFVTKTYKEVEIGGKYRAMTVSINPSKTRAIISRRYFFQEKSGMNPPAIVFDISNGIFENEREFPITEESVALSEFISDTKAVVVTGTHQVNGTNLYFDIAKSKVTQTGGGVDVIDYALVHNYDVKISADMTMFTNFNASYEYYVWSISTGLLKTAGAWRDISPVYERYTNIARFNPEESVNQIFVGADYYKLGIVDSSKLEAEDKTQANLFSETKDWKQFDSHISPVTLAFNSLDTTHLLLMYYTGSNADTTSGMYLQYTGTDIEIKALLKFGYTSPTFYFLTNPYNIQGTGFFFINSFSINNLETAITHSFIVNSEFTPSVDPLPELSFLNVTDSIRPDGVTNNPNVLGMGLIDLDTGRWMVVGNDNDGTTDGWAMILELEQTSEYVPTCHDDCIGCVNKVEETRCLACVNNRFIIPPSGCYCSENCTSCTKNNEFDKCTSCIQGKLLTKDLEEEGPSSCEDCHESCVGCSLGANPEACIACPFGYGLTTLPGPSSCGKCHELCDGCTVAGDPSKCIKCIEWHTTYEDGDYVCELDRKIAAGLVKKKCGDIEIPGCEKCQDDPSLGCKRCQRRAGIEVVGNLSVCIFCPDELCEECEVTSFNGRQCQKCLDNVTFDYVEQRCFVRLVVVIGWVLGSLWLLI